jgi:NADH-quinone oxidoreductase subunit F
VIRVSAGADAAPLAERASSSWEVREVGSTGHAALEPLVCLTHGGETALYTQCSSSRMKTVAAACLESGDLAGAGPRAVVDHDPEPANGPQTDVLPGVRAVLGGCGWRRPTSVDDHERAGGFVDPATADVFDAGDGLLGRGWSDWAHDEPVADSWEQATAADGRPTVVVNGHDTPADRLLLESAPFEALDGANALARAVDAERVVVYCSGADEHALDVATEAVDAFPDPAAPMDIVAGTDVYRAGEPTMAIEDIEGNHRLEARRRPPGPPVFGLDGQPTLVHTPRTMAHLAVSLRGEVPETRVVTVEGDVDATATLELPESATLDDALDAVSVDGQFKAACVGGRFGGLTDSLATALDPDSLTAAGLGTDGIVHVLSADQCLLSFIGKRASFGADTNCGRCVPCREGTTQLTELLRDVYDGQYDRAKLEELTDVMATTSLCSFGVAAARPVETALATFESEIEAHADGRCPAGTCSDPMEAR